MFGFCSSLWQNFVAHGAGVWDFLCVLCVIVFVDESLLPLLNVFPVGNMVDVENHVSSKNQLCWEILQGGKGCSHCRGSDTQISLPRIVLIWTIVFQFLPFLGTLFQEIHFLCCVSFVLAMGAH